MIKCADDFGLNTDVNMAILDLASLKKIESTSVLIKLLSDEDCQKLQELAKNGFKVGLHIDLFSNLKSVFTSLLAADACYLEISEQVDLFKKKFGFFPHHYDGHMHCHIYPAASAGLIRKIKELQIGSIYIRSLKMKYELVNYCTDFRKLMYLFWLMFFNFFFLRKLKKYNLLTNDFVYGAFNGHASFEDILELTEKYKDEKNSILFFHPSLKSNEFEAFNRLKEYTLLKN